MATATSNTAQLQTAVRREIVRYGSLDNAILGLHNDGCANLLSAALRLKSLSSETLAERAARLIREADSLLAKADHELAEAAQDELVVIVRRAKWGRDDETARDVEGRARAAKAYAADLQAEARRLRSQARALHRAA
jgi:hypothetical protein